MLGLTFNPYTATMHLFGGWVNRYDVLSTILDSCSCQDIMIQVSRIQHDKLKIHTLLYFKEYMTCRSWSWSYTWQQCPNPLVTSTVQPSTKLDSCQNSMIQVSWIQQDPYVVVVHGIFDLLGLILSPDTATVALLTGWSHRCGVPSTTLDSCQDSMVQVSRKGHEKFTIHTLLWPAEADLDPVRGNSAPTLWSSHQ